jgi:hypothetical protein
MARPDGRSKGYSAFPCTIDDRLGFFYSVHCQIPVFHWQRHDDILALQSAADSLKRSLTTNK